MAGLPDLEPMRATAADALPTGDRWAFEPKWDGMRILAGVDGGVRLRSSRGLAISYHRLTGPFRCRTNTRLYRFGEMSDSMSPVSPFAP